MVLNGNCGKAKDSLCLGKRRKKNGKWMDSYRDFGSFIGRVFS